MFCDIAALRNRGLRRLARFESMKNT